MQKKIIPFAQNINQEQQQMYDEYKSQILTSKFDHTRREVQQILKDVEMTYEELLSKLQSDEKAFGAFLKRICPRISEQPKWKDEQIEVCKNLAQEYGINITKAISKQTIKNKDGFSLSLVLDAEVRGNIQGSIMSKIAMGDYPHNIFRECLPYLEYMARNLEENEYFIFLIETEPGTEILDQVERLKLFWEKHDNIKIMNHEQFQEFVQFYNKQNEMITAKQSIKSLKQKIESLLAGQT